MATLNRDRHGRVTAFSALDFEAIGEIARQERIRSELSLIVRQIYLDRNAKGFPTRYRAAIKPEARPYLRMALRHAAKARTALLESDGGRVGELEYELEKAKAGNYLYAAALACARIYNASASAKQKIRRRGGQAPAAVAAGRKRKTVSDRVRDLARRQDELGGWEPARELWENLFSALDEEGQHPKAISQNRNPHSIEYTVDGKSKTIKFASFKAMLSGNRKEKG